MALKLSSRQQAQLAYLDALVPRIARIHTLIEKLNSPTEMESSRKSLGRLLDELKSGASGLGLNGVAATAAGMSGLARGTGGLHTRVRGLREGLAGLKINCDGARKAASKPAAENEEPGSAT
ncbi:MAG: hypothetical protein ABI613_00990 [Gemmatimonadota bacterium]